MGTTFGARGTECQRKVYPYCHKYKIVFILDMKQPNTTNLSFFYELLIINLAQLALL